jgi:hypothetical protein
MEKKKSQLFIPMYCKYGRWYYYRNLMTDSECSEYFDKNDVFNKNYQPMVLPYNCKYCPKFFIDIFVQKYILFNRYPKRLKE